MMKNLPAPDAPLKIGTRGSPLALWQAHEVRRSQNWIGGSRPGNAAYVPPPAHALPELLSTRYVSGADTMFVGIQKLLPGHRLVFEHGDVRIRPRQAVGLVAGPGLASRRPGEPIRPASPTE